LGHAWSVPSSGIYYFNISGTAFSTYVEAGNGWILIASGSASTNEGSYGRTHNLTLQSDKILPASVYASNDITKVRINATSGPSTPFDVETSDAQTLNNLRSDITLSLNSDGSAWTGTGTSHMLKLYGCTSTDSLSRRIYHGCNNGNGLHWLMPDNIEKVNYSSGENNLNLWVRANAAALLPVELVDFTAKKEINQVNLSWQTASESHNGGFQIQRSTDGRNWETLSFAPGNGTTQEVQSYDYTDRLPLPGMNYYRLMQIDFDGQSAYSKVVSVDMANAGNGIRISPNPASGDALTVFMTENLDVKTQAQLFDTAGRLICTVRLGKGANLIDVSGLKTGIYILKAGQLFEKIAIRH
jgi:hypothetical protein